MSQANISIRVEKTVKDRFTSLCDAFGLTTTAAFNLFMKAVIRERKIPFEISIDEEQEKREIAINNFKSMRYAAAQSGMQDLSLEEINRLIKETRDGKRK